MLLCREIHKASSNGLQTTAGRDHAKIDMEFEVFTAVTMSIVVFWDWRRGALVTTDVSEKRVASIFWLKKSSLADISTLNIVVTCYSET
jgi:hypothetical protein